MFESKRPDSPIGEIIRARLEEMERSQPWLARQTHRCGNTINGIIKGRLTPSNELIKSMSDVLDVDVQVLREAVKKGSGV